MTYYTLDQDKSLRPKTVELATVIEAAYTLAATVPFLYS